MLGVSCRLLGAATSCEELEQSLDHSLCVLASASTMCEVSLYSAAMECLFRKARFLFVYGFRPQAVHNFLACFLTDGLLSQVRRFTRNDLEYQVATSHPDITREFSGLSFGPINTDIDFAFVPSSKPCRCSPLVAIDGMPLWGLIERDRCSLFMLACSEIADIDELTDGNLSVTERFSRLLPAAMFVKSVFKQYCWHARHRLANVIIDDPLLKESYGFLNYRQLLKHMEETRFSATIGFIPWNYNRTQRTVAELFLQRSDRLSICVHGCDHSEAEFAGENLGRLNAKILLASHRMKVHEKLTGLPHCKVMVFPQGQFSTQALIALKSNNYLAAVNARVTPSNLGKQVDVTVAECLGLAVTRYGFPLFLRRYPVVNTLRGGRTGTIEEFACDLFFGKPALVAEHHGVFKDHGKNLLEFVNRLNSLNGCLEWTGLRDVIAKTYLERDVSDQLRLCKIYSNYQLIENDGDRSRNYIIMKHEDGDVPVERVLVNGEGSPFRLSNNQLCLFARIPAMQAANVRIVYRSTLPASSGREYLTGSGSLWCRRLLSELRDNVLCRNELLLTAAYAAKRKLFRSPALHSCTKRK